MFNKFPGQLFLYDLFCSSYRSDVGIDTLIPVQETFHVDLVADLKSFYSFVYIRIFVTQIRFYSKGIGLTV